MNVSWQLILYQMVNFILLMVLLTFLFNKFIRPFLDKRANDIKTSFESIEKQRAEVEQLKQDYADQMHDIRKSAKAEIDKAIENGNALRDEIITRAEKESITIIERAKKEIDHERQKAITEIQKELAILSVAAARHLIKKEMDEKTNRQLVEEFLAELDKKEAR